jgi:hypothetical protein
MTKKLNTLFYVALLTLMAISVFSCNNDKEDCEVCEGQFVNIETGEYLRKETDCERVPPEGYVFVRCLEVEY